MVSIDYKAVLRQYSEPIQDLAQRAITFLNDAAKMASPMQMAFSGREVSPIEVMALEQSRRYPEVPQNTYPAHTQNGWHPSTPYKAPNGSPKSRHTQIYHGEARIRNNINHRSNKKPVSIRQSRVRKAKIPFMKYSSGF